MRCQGIIVQKGVLFALFKLFPLLPIPPFFQNYVSPPDKQYFLKKDFAFQATKLQNRKYFVRGSDEDGDMMGNGGRVEVKF